MFIGLNNITKEQIIEGNKLIPEFMRWKYHPETANHGIIDNTWEYKKGYYHFELRFHKSWDVLMPVVEKVEMDERVSSFNILSNCVEIEMNTGDDISIIVWEDVPKILPVFIAVVEFIKWYNANK